ncbi:unnamed protein product [Fraxinus pennsylvanica]|uniref:Uncharacterized protein n=1 Tax=Fraxinus pennsylvanica TaxID=56036 RepID=A0AAD2A3U9_9LAMI|nr:unnamed protein product [Fraxinus pennsylvanica]
MPVFQVFINDRTSNVFNILFASLPSERQYYAPGVPDSFHCRAFPKASIHFAYSSCALTWLSEIPKEVLDPLSPAWNKGRISYYGEKNEVSNAFSAQFAKDLDSFLKARAEELVDEGLLTFIHGVEPNANKDTSKITLPSFELLGSCLVDLAKKGLFDISKVDSFNLPKYFPFHDELKALVERNQDFSLERMEILDNPPKRLTNPDPKSFAMFMRVLIKGLLQNHFGREIMDELLDIWRKS